MSWNNIGGNNIKEFITNLSIAAKKSGHDGIRILAGAWSSHDYYISIHNIGSGGKVISIISFALELYWSVYNYNTGTIDIFKADKIAL